MRKIILPLLLALLLFAGCGKAKVDTAPMATAEPAPAAETELPTAVPPQKTEITVSPAPAKEVPSTAAAVTAESSVGNEVPGSSKLAMRQEEGAEEGILLTCWSYAGREIAEFYGILLPLPEELPIEIGTMYEGENAALLTGVVRGDKESGTAEMLLAVPGEEAKTVLTLMYARDRVALLELDDAMKSFCRQDGASGLWLVVFTEDGPLSFAEAGALLNEILRAHNAVPAYTAYGSESGALLDLRVNN